MNVFLESVKNYRIHFIGVSGAGMSALARYCLEYGLDVSGSDTDSPDSRLIDAGLRFFHRQHLGNIDENCYCVYSSAIADTNVERRNARNAVSRGEFLAKIANAATSVAVCGTHGKGTTAGYIVHALEKLGKNPSYILGAKFSDGGMSSRLAGECLVVEVDESDRTHMLHLPAILLVNNIEADHLNNYKNLDDIVRSFETLALRTLDAGKSVVINVDSEGSAVLANRLRRQRPNAPVFFVSLSQCADYRAENVEVDDKDFHAFDAAFDNCRLARLSASLAGKANAENTLSAFAVLHRLGFEPSEIASALSSFAGMSDRFEVFRQKSGKAILVTDYASHPTCIANDLAALRKIASEHKITAVYHPYRPTLMRYHFDALVDALSAADETLYLPLDPCGEQPLPGIDSQSFAEATRCARAVAFDDLPDIFLRRFDDGGALIIFAGPKLFEQAKSFFVDRCPQKM